MKTHFPPNWNMEQIGSSEAYRGADGRIIKAGSLVEVDFSKFTPDGKKAAAKHYPFKHGETMLFLFEIQKAPGHCVVVNKKGKVLWMYHTDNFRALTEDEL